MDGLVSLIFSTQRHFANAAPSFLYCAQRSDSPSKPMKQVRITSYVVHGILYVIRVLQQLIKLQLVGLTLCGGFPRRSCQGDNTFVNLRDKEESTQNGNFTRFQMLLRCSVKF